MQASAALPTAPALLRGTEFSGWSLPPSECVKRTREPRVARATALLCWTPGHPSSSLASWEPGTCRLLTQALSLQIDRLIDYGADILSPVTLTQGNKVAVGTAVDYGYFRFYQVRLWVSCC